MSVIGENPQWDILELLDGFGLHNSDPRALDLLAKNHIPSTKYEYKTFHVNQAYKSTCSKEMQEDSGRDPFLSSANKTCKQGRRW